MIEKSILSLYKDSIKNILGNFSYKLSKIRTSVVNTDLLSDLKIQIDNSYFVSLKSIASIGSSNNSIVISPWNIKHIKQIEKSILKSNLDLNPIIIKKTIKVFFPPLTEEYRNNLTKLTKSNAENYRIQVRNERRKFIKLLKIELKDNLINKDEEKNIQIKIQRETQVVIKNINLYLERKLKEIMII